MVIKNTHQRETKIKRFQVKLISFFCMLLMTAFYSHSEDLVAGTDLQDSPLSISLTTTIPIVINNQTQQITITQYGILNKATITQISSNANEINITQKGINNEINILQTGYDNIVNIDQYGDDNLAEVIQDGDANIANIWQAGEQHFTVHQIGNDMVVDIIQY